nr:Transposase [Escherichia coli]
MISLSPPTICSSAADFCCRPKFAALKRGEPCALASAGSDHGRRLRLLDEQLATVTRTARTTGCLLCLRSGLKIAAGCGAGSGAGADRPNQPVTAASDRRLLMDVDDWTGFSRPSPA